MSGKNNEGLVAKEFVLDEISEQINTYRKCAAGVLCASLLALTWYLADGMNMQGDVMSLRAAVGMIAVMVAMWIAHSSLNEQASRYMSLYHSIANEEGERVKPTLYVKRPVWHKIYAMWTQPESIFYVAAIATLALLSFTF